MQNELTSVAIVAFLASTVSAQTPTTASVERLVYLTNTPSRKLAQLPPELMALLWEGVEAAAHRRDAALARLKEHEATHQIRSAAAS